MYRIWSSNGKRPYLYEEPQKPSIRETYCLDRHLLILIVSVRTLPIIRPISEKSLGPKEVRLRALSDTNVNFTLKLALLQLLLVIYCVLQIYSPLFIARGEVSAVILFNRSIYCRRLICFQVIRPYPVQSFDCTPIAH